MASPKEAAARTREEVAPLVSAQDLHSSPEHPRPGCSAGRVALHASWLVAFFVGVAGSIAVSSRTTSKQAAVSSGAAAHAAHAAHGARVEDVASVRGLLNEGRKGVVAPRRSMKQRGKKAFAILARGASGTLLEEQDEIWGALATAHALQRLSRYPMVLLTDVTHFPDGTRLQDALDKLDVEVRPLVKVAPMPGDDGEESKNDLERTGALQNLQAWTLTDYEKIVWLDPLAIPYRDIDWLFDREGMWAARDDPECKMDSEAVSAGVLVLYPNKEDFDGLRKHVGAISGDNVTFGSAISSYFKDVRKEPIQLLSEVEADYGKCFGSRIPTPYRNTDGTPVTGAWSTPAIVHKSGGISNAWVGKETDDNICFRIDLTKQRIPTHGAIRNVCHYHPLGSYWRDQFCGAAKQLLVVDAMPMVAKFCSDTCYYLELNCGAIQRVTLASGAIVHAPRKKLLEKRK